MGHTGSTWEEWGGLLGERSPLRMRSIGWDAPGEGGRKPASGRENRGTKARRQKSRSPWKCRVAGEDATGRRVGTSWAKLGTGQEDPTLGNWGFIRGTMGETVTVFYAEAWSFNTLTTWCEELTHWKRPWCWERLKAAGEGDDRGWDGWMASLTQWTWVWANSGSWGRTGKPGVLQSTGLQSIRHDWVTEQQWRDEMQALEDHPGGHGENRPQCSKASPREASQEPLSGVPRSLIRMLWRLPWWSNG